MVKQRQDEGVAYQNTALSRIKLSNSLDAAIAEGREDEADFCREQLAKVCVWCVHGRELLRACRSPLSLAR